MHTNQPPKKRLVKRLRDEITLLAVFSIIGFIICLCVIFEESVYAKDYHKREKFYDSLEIKFEQDSFQMKLLNGQIEMWKKQYYECDSLKNIK